MNMKTMCRQNILLIIAILIATFISSCISSDTRTTDEIATVEGQIKNIDQQIAKLMVLKRSRISTARNDDIVEGILIDKVYNKPIDEENNRIGAEIYKLSSQREILVAKLTSLYQSLNR